MKPFLSEIAEHLYRTQGEKLKDCCMVFPNRRAGLFFQQYLSMQIDKPIWSPAIFTINDLMITFSDLSPADDLDILFELYDIFIKHTGSKETFDDFYFWGEIMISDFDDIDKYLVKPEDLFENIAALKKIEDRFSYLTEEQIKVIQRFWKSFDPEKPGKHGREFFDLWQALLPVYQKLNQSLKNRGIGYEGMIYRNVSDKIRTGHELKIPWDSIIFAGFNALNECEKELFREIQKKGKAVFYWDYDNYYVSDKNHEAGRFIRKNLKEFPTVDDAVNCNNLAEGKNIRIISIPSNAGQAKILSQFLDPSCDDSPQTAVVLADENLLIPVLYSLPSSLTDLNVTMGYPVNETPAYSLVEHIVNLQNNSRQTGGQEEKFYYQDVLSILNHQYILKYPETECQQIIQEIKSKNSIYIPKSRFRDNSLLSAIFRKTADVLSIPRYLLDILEMVVRNGIDRENPDGEIENEIIYKIYNRIKRLDQIIKSRHLSFKTSTFLRLLRKIILKTRIPFSGEPLTGLQVMGVLETRSLDFQKVIILSMSEGIFPGGFSVHSFIPHYLRHGFNLPVVEHQDAIYAYYFYRLIQRAEDIICIYNSKTEGMNTGERSRFLHQLVFNPLFHTTETAMGYEVLPLKDNPVVITKNNEIINKLNHYIEGDPGNRYLSPSAINTYLDCSLSFYLRYIAGLEEPDEVKEEIDQLLFGTLLHSAINKLYDEYKTKTITEEVLNKIIHDGEKMQQAVQFAFNKVLGAIPGSEGKKIEGKYVLVSEILENYLKGILEADRRFTPFTIISMEEKYGLIIPVDTPGGLKRIKIGGKIDRIDQTGNEVRIIDYKTGETNLKINSIEEIFDRSLKGRNNAVFQTFLYTMLYLEVAAYKEYNLTPGLYPVKGIYTEKFDYHIQIGPPKQKENLIDFRLVEYRFKQYLVEVLSEMMDPGVAFSQTEVAERCTYCPYAVLCHR